MGKSSAWSASTIIVMTNFQDVISDIGFLVRNIEWLHAEYHLMYNQMKNSHGQNHERSLPNASCSDYRFDLICEAYRKMNDLHHQPISVWMGSRKTINCSFP